VTALRQLQQYNPILSEHNVDLGTVAEVGSHPTHEKRSSFSRAQCFGASVGNEAAVLSQVDESVPTHVDQTGDLELDAPRHWKQEASAAGGELYRILMHILDFPRRPNSVMMMENNKQHINRLH